MTIPGLMRTLIVLILSEDTFLYDLSCLLYNLKKSENIPTNSSREPESFASSGLRIEPIVPYSKWRITFNGLIEIKKSGETINSTDSNAHHVIFTFL